MPEDPTPRIDELREKVARDPSSRVFLQLAEEYRKAGKFEEAVEVCQEGLKHHPNYTSARVTRHAPLPPPSALAPASWLTCWPTSRHSRTPKYPKSY